LCSRQSGFLNESQSRSHEGAHIFLSENEPFPHFNSAVLSIAQIIKFVMASAAESELAALFITAHEMIPHHQTLIDIMGWPQPKSPIQTNNSTASGVVNNTMKNILKYHHHTEKSSIDNMNNHCILVHADLPVLLFVYRHFTKY
jgi:hypothetical protein